METLCIKSGSLGICPHCLVAPALLLAQEEKKKEPPKQVLVGYKNYRGLLGQDYSGNVFVIRFNGRLVAVMSKHQFGEGIVPSRAEDLDTDKPRELTFILDMPADVRGGSGHEIIHVKSGKPIGVLIAANNGGKDATRIVFEPICLPISKGETEK